MAKTIIVSNRLPVRIEKNEEELIYKPSEGGLATGLGSIYKEGNNIWIGWPGEAFESQQVQEEVTQNLTEHNMRPVFLTEEDVEDFYLGFSNQTLWPACHYFIHHIHFDSKGWTAYERANRKFADAIIKSLEPGDIVWVHDYQLLLVPAMVREEFPDVTIGFFQHIPFPSYEVFRMLPWRKQLLQGMLGADYVCFHTYDDMRHFLSSVHRLVGYAYSQNRVLTEDRIVEADSLPMGIDYDKYYNSAQSDEAKEREKRYRESVGNARMVLSMDRLDYSKGIPQRLKAFEEFFENYPEYREKVSLLLIVVPSRDVVPSYQHLKEEVDELVGRINGKFGRMSWTPVHYFYRSYPLSALSAFYRMCDIAMITPMRDGMNLVCKEFIASKKDRKGVLILSEMAGSSKELSDAILINPNDRKQIIEALKQAMEMSEDEQVHRMAIMQESLQKYNIFKWVEVFIQNLKKVKENQQSMSTTSLNKKVSESITDSYKNAKKRLIFLDYDGTLVPFQDDPNACAPDAELLSILEKLTADKKNEIVVISGRKSQNLDDWLGHLPIDFIAEHGIWFKKQNTDWVLHANADAEEWKDEAREIMNFYVDRTPGAFIEEKKHALVWHYRKAEKGLGDLRSSELSSHLKHFMGGKGLDILEGDQVVEIKPAEVNKGKAALSRLSHGEYDFIAAFGDDRTDEDTFQALPKRAFTVKVGGGYSFARFGVNNHKAVRSLLSSFVS